MASVPNMRLGAAAPANGGGIPVDGEAGDLFARLLSSTPILDGATELSILPGGNPTAEAPVASEEQPAEGEEILLALTTGMVFQPIVVPAVPAREAPSPQSVPAGEAPPPQSVPAEAPAAAHAVALTTPTPTPLLEAKIETPTSTSPQPKVAAPAQPQAEAATPVQPPAIVQPGSAIPTPVKAEIATSSPATSAQPAIAAGPQIDLARPEFAAAKAIPTKAATARAAPPAVREAQAAATAAPIVEPQPARPSERPKPIPAAPASEKPAGPLSSAVPLSFLTPAAILSAIAPELSLTAQPLSQQGPQPQDVAQQLIEHELDLAQDSEWLDQLARDIARGGSSEGPMRFRLHPQTLGHLQVEVAQRDNGAAIRLTVDTEAARTIVADAQPRLIAEARAQGVRVAETHVDLAGARDHAAGEQRRHEEGRQNPTIRTARAAGGEAQASAAEPRAKSERYA